MANHHWYYVLAIFSDSFEGSCAMAGFVTSSKIAEKPAEEPKTMYQNIFFSVHVIHSSMVCVSNYGVLKDRSSHRLLVYQQTFRTLILFYKFYRSNVVKLEET